MTKPTRLPAVGLAALALAGCSAGSGGKAHPVLSHSPLPDRAGRGVIAGRFLAVGGPLGASPAAQRGRIVVRQAGQVVKKVTVAQDGHYSFLVLPGRYTLTGFTPQFHVNGKQAACNAPHPAIVRAGHTTHLNVYCQRR